MIVEPAPNRVVSPGWAYWWAGYACVVLPIIFLVFGMGGIWITNAYSQAGIGEEGARLVYSVLGFVFCAVSVMAMATWLPVYIYFVYFKCSLCQRPLHSTNAFTWPSSTRCLNCDAAIVRDLKAKVGREG